jgi:hypothetical protein
MNRQILLTFFILFGISLPLHSQVFYTASFGMNLTYRDLSVTGETSDVMKNYFEIRRKIERPAFGEEFSLGIGNSFNEKFKFQTGVFYKRFGDVEKDDLIMYIEESETYEYREAKIRHTFQYVGVPLIFDYYLMNLNQYSFGIRLAPELNYLINSKTKVRNGENVFGDPIGYSSYITQQKDFNFGIKTGFLCSMDLDQGLSLNMNLLFNYHLIKDLTREEIVHQRHFALGFNFGLSKSL